MLGIIDACFILMGVTLLWYSCAMTRSHKVAAYRRDLIDKIGAAYESELQAGVPYTRWRWEHYEQVSYEAMAWSFRPLDSFYPDRRFLEPLQSGETPPL